PAIFVTLLWLNYAISSAKNQQEFIESIILGDDSTWQVIIISFGTSLIGLIYLLMSSALIYKKRKTSKAVFTNLETLKIDYILEFMWIVIIEIIILLIAYMFIPVLYIDLIWVPFLGNIMYLYIIYKSHNYGTLFSTSGYEVYKNLYV